MNLFDNENIQLLVDALVSIKEREQCRLFLEDIMTSNELISISQRLEVARLLCGNGKYSEVAEKTGASTATIGRVNRCIQYGGGGYRAVLEAIGAIGQGEG